MRNTTRKQTFSYLKRIGPERVAREYLFPLMERESGNAFCMAYWLCPLGSYGKPGDILYDSEFDNVDRVIPACNSIQCIGGSLQFLVKPESLPIDLCELQEGPDTMVATEEALGQLLGLDKSQTYGLFNRWYSRSFFGSCVGYGWPDDLQAAYRNAKTPAQKVKVAKRAILRAIKTKGKCMEAPMRDEFEPNS